MGRPHTELTVKNPLELAEERNGKGQPNHFGVDILVISCNVLCQGRNSVGRNLFLDFCTVINAANDLPIEELDLEKRKVYATHHIT